MGPQSEEIIGSRRRLAAKSYPPPGARSEGPPRWPPSDLLVPFMSRQPASMRRGLVEDEDEPKPVGSKSSRILSPHELSRERALAQL